MSLKKKKQKKTHLHQKIRKTQKEKNLMQKEHNNSKLKKIKNSKTKEKFKLVNQNLRL